MGIIFTGMEGGWARYTNTLNGAYADSFRRGSVALGSSQYMIRDFVGSKDIWVHMKFRTNGFDWHDPAEFFRIRDSSNNTLMGLQSTGSGITVSVVKWRTSSGVLGQAPGYNAGYRGLHTYDFNIKITTTTVTDDTITYTFYMNRVKIHEETFVDSVAFNEPANLYCSAYLNPTYVGNGVGYYQDFIVTDGIPTVGMELAFMAPDAAGNYSAMTGDYTAIDDLGYSEVDALVATTGGERESWSLANVTIPSVNHIYAVANNPMAKIDTGVTDFNTFTRIASIDYDEANLSVPSGTPKHFSDILLTNPNTALPWTQSDLDSLEVGIRSS